MDAKNFRLKKWACIYRFLDVNRDGVLSFEELMSYPVKLITSRQVEHGIRLARLYTDLWNKVLEGAGRSGKQIQMSLETFQDGLEQLKDQKWFIDEFIKVITAEYFTSLDTDNSGEISFTEWRVFYNKRGIDDENFLKRTFKKLDENQDGVISRAEFEYAFQMIGLSEDPEKDYTFLYDKA